MKRIAFVLLLTLAATPLWGGCPGNNCYFYGGDSSAGATVIEANFADALANENDAIISGSPYGAAIYQNFASSYYISVAGLFTNNLSQITPTSGYWEIRSGVSEGNGGMLIASGTGNVTNTPTGRSGFGYTEYHNEVDGLYVLLSPGTYWFAVVPNCTTCAGRSWNTNTTGLNSVGTTIPNEQYFNSSFFGANFTNANNYGTFPTFSSGVLVPYCSGSCGLDSASDVPEPSSFILLGSGLMGAAVAALRRMS